MPYLVDRDLLAGTRSLLCPQVGELEREVLTNQLATAFSCSAGRLHWFYVTSKIRGEIL